MQKVPMLTKPGKESRRRERGAALITTLLMSTLLLTAGGALILTTAMAVTNAYDSTSETQAYYAAEAGLQATLNVLRGNVSPALSYRDAITPASSNATSDPATTATTPWARLSKWLTYDATYTDRVILTTPYSPLNGAAFNTVVTDPDNSAQVTYTTSGVFDNGTATKTFGTGANKSTITFVPRTATLSAYPSVTDNLGSFQTTVTGTGAAAPAVPVGTTFTLTITQSAPWYAKTDILCTLSGTTLTAAASNVVVTFPALGFSGQGTVYTLGALILTLNAPATAKTIPVTVTAPQPKRLLVRVNGFGPRGSRKQMEVMVGRALFDYTPRSTIALRSADDGTTQMTFGAGPSAAHSYSGNDNAGGNIPIAAFSVTSSVDYSLINGLAHTSGVPPTEQARLQDLSSWLQSADEARRTLNRLEAAARGMNRYFTSAAPPADYGTIANPAFTFVNGDCSPGGGAGLVVCTGTVDFRGNESFKGLILALGDGALDRNGGGNGVTLGAVAIARFDRNNWGGPFLSPSYTTSGGGNSDVLYDSVWVQRAINAGGRYVIGVSEY